MASRMLDQKIVFTDPPIAEKLLNSTSFALVWLVVRLYVGYQWLSSGLGKLSNPAWTVTGEALQGFWARAVAIPEAPARPAITYDWYRAFLQGLLDSGSHVWFAKLVVAGEILIGIALILGLFTAIAAFFGGFMNWNFMMAGTASTNPVLFTLSILLILAWKTAGYWGLDRFVLPMLGTPWQPGKVFKGKAEA
ncbi:MAG: DoxX family protein [Chloroflexi bacterium]|nr:DoxX family protein [Chloroflexota bacterium]